MMGEGKLKKRLKVVEILPPVEIEEWVRLDYVQKLIDECAKEFPSGVYAGVKGAVKAGREKDEWFEKWFGEASK